MIYKLQFWCALNSWQMISIYTTTEATWGVPNICPNIWSNTTAFPEVIQMVVNELSSVTTDVWMVVKCIGQQIIPEVFSGCQMASCVTYTPTVRPIEFKLIYRAAMKRTSPSINKHDFTALSIGKSSFPGCLYYIKSYHNIELL